jgi:hypothetical protein
MSQKTYPTTDIAVPANDRAGDPGVVTDNGVAHDDTSLEANTGADLGTGTDDDVGADEGGAENVRRSLSVGLQAHGSISAV